VIRALTTCVVVLALGLGLSPGHAQTGVSADATFARLFAEYRRGNHDAAVQAFSRWKPERVKADARLGDGVDDVASVAALALFHTEAGMRNRTFGQIAEDELGEIALGGWGLEKVFEPHSYAAYRAVDDVIKRARRDQNTGLLSYAKSWYIVAISYCRRWNHDPCVDELIDKGEHDLDGDEDPEYLLLIGSIAEPRRWAYPGARLREPASFHSGVGQESRWAFTQALKRNPQLVEARMRLGRVHWVTNDRVVAERELTQALEEAKASRHLFALHLASLFLGELAEEDGHVERALDLYRASVDSVPYAHTAAVALGQALVRTGRHDEGWLVARQMFGREGPDHEPVLDPFGIYDAAQYWQGASRVRAMREMVRQ
jgi:tetratricopeptide (TPR) repeat protein